MVGRAGGSGLGRWLLSAAGWAGSGAPKAEALSKTHAPELHSPAVVVSSWVKPTAEGKHSEALRKLQKLQILTTLTGG